MGLGGKNWQQHEGPSTCQATGEFTVFLGNWTTIQLSQAWSLKQTISPHLTIDLQLLLLLILSAPWMKVIVRVHLVHNLSISHLSDKHRIDLSAKCPLCLPPWGALGDIQNTLFFLRGGRVLLTEILLPRIARLASNCSTGNCLSSFNKRISSKNSNCEFWARKARIEKFELDEGFQPYHAPFRALFVWGTLGDQY